MLRVGCGGILRFFLFRGFVLRFFTLGTFGRLFFRGFVLRFFAFGVFGRFFRGFVVLGVSAGSSAGSSSSVSSAGSSAVRRPQYLRQVLPRVSRPQYLRQVLPRVRRPRRLRRVRPRVRRPRRLRRVRPAVRRPRRLRRVRLPRRLRRVLPRVPRPQYLRRFFRGCIFLWSVLRVFIGDGSKPGPYIGLVFLGLFFGFIRGLFFFGFLFGSDICCLLSVICIGRSFGLLLPGLRVFGCVLRRHNCRDRCLLRAFSASSAAFCWAMYSWMAFCFSASKSMTADAAESEDTSSSGFFRTSANRIINL